MKWPRTQIFRLASRPSAKRCCRLFRVPTTNAALPPICWPPPRTPSALRRSRLQSHSSRGFGRAGSQCPDRDAAGKRAAAAPGSGAAHSRDVRRRAGSDCLALAGLPEHVRHPGACRRRTASDADQGRSGTPRRRQSAGGRRPRRGQSSSKTWSPNATISSKASPSCAAPSSSSIAKASRGSTRLSRRSTRISNGCSRICSAAAKRASR